MHALDAIVTVDTSIAHVAGAFGLPIWVMMPFAADWRWLTNREDSPWYPTMRCSGRPLAATGKECWRELGGNFLNGPPREMRRLTAS